MEISLGTANICTQYGITNCEVLNTDQARALLIWANNLGIREVDTAPAYGGAEDLLGSFDTGTQFYITTKCAALTDLAVSEQVKRSLCRLRVDRVHRILVHDWSKLCSDTAADVVAQMRSVKQMGAALEVGISVYDRADLELAYTHFPDVDCIQFPVSILDQRLVHDPLLASFRENKVSLYARSILLQGVLASTIEYRRAHKDLVKVHDFASKMGISPLRLSLQFITSMSWLDGVVIGANSLDQLSETHSLLLGPPVQEDWGQFASSDELLLDPRKWP